MKAAMFVTMATLIAGAACVVAGVHILAGLGWSLVTAGLSLWGFATIIIRGMTRNG